MRNLLVFLWITLTVLSASAQRDSNESLHITAIPKEGFWFTQNWKFQAGDNLQWADPAFDDSNWQGIEPSKDLHTLPELWKTNIGWFRLHFTIDSIVAKESLNLLVQQTGASEIYLNGQLLGAFGKISTIPKQVQAVSPVFGSFVPFPANKAGEQVLAIRFAIQKNIPYISFFGNTVPAFLFAAIKTQHISNYINSSIGFFLDFTRLGLFLTLAILHFVLYRFNPSQKANLYFFIYTLLNCLFILMLGLVDWVTQLVTIKMLFLFGAVFGLFVGTLFLLLAVYKTFHQTTNFKFWLIVAVVLLSTFSLGISYKYSFWLSNLFIILPFMEIIRITMLAARKKQRGALLVIGGVIGFILFFVLFNLIGLGYLPLGPNGIYAMLTITLSLICIPISISVYLALESSYASRTLGEKIIEVQQLSQQAIKQEQEKQQLLTNQNEKLDQQVKEQTASLRQSLQELKATQAQLIQSEKMASLGELTAGIAHEIQNPLNFVNNFSETNTELIEEARSELIAGNHDETLALMNDIKENEQKINHHGKRADTIVKNMLEHSRTSKGEQQSTDINALADEYLQLAYHGFRAKDKSFNANIETNFDESVGIINIVPQEIGRVLLNLFNNAFYAVHEQMKKLGASYEPRVSVSTKKQHDKIVITVQDNGMGISKSVQDKIFQPFFTTKPTGEGTGLGLSLSYDIIKAHGGELKAEGMQNEGALFILELPLDSK